MKNWMLVGIPLLGSLLTGCGDSAADVGASSVTATQAQNGATLPLAKGATFAVELPGNPTTGYEWTVSQADPAHLRLAASAYAPESSATGAGGTYSFRFEALQPGSTALALAYRRSWERTSADATFSLSVAIHDGQGRLPADE